LRQVDQKIFSIFANKYDAAFFSQFDIIVSALDNVAARRHLSEMAIKVGKPIVDAGTEGFSGQAKAVKRFLNDCHNCIPQVKEESFAVCTIRNTPERPVHCVAYAKTLYD
jgi:ubiquitin-like 1-activating enzyme E1 B